MAICTICNIYKQVVGSPHPGGGEAPKGLAVRQLKWYASWVQTVEHSIECVMVEEHIENMCEATLTARLNI